MLGELMSGRVLPAGELAFRANISAQTASHHLRRLLEGGLIAVASQGRHRYYRLAGDDVAAAIEALGNVPQPRLAAPPPSPKERDIKRLRRCYRHLAGTVAVAATDVMVARGFLAPQGDQTWELTPAGREWFAALGLPPAVIDAPDGRRRRVKQCLDWTERRYHLAGPIGVAFFHRLVELKWIAGTRDSRAMRVTSAGLAELERRLGVTVPRV
jgi:hypothetical protein